MTTTALPGHRVVVFLQENKTVDFYFPTLAAWGAAVANHGNLLSVPPNFDQPHDRTAWVHWAMGDYPAEPLQIDNDALIPFYSWLAKQFTFCDHHFALGSNSTSGHMLAVGGQTPTLKNPPFVGAHPTLEHPVDLLPRRDRRGVAGRRSPTRPATRPSCTPAEHHRGAEQHPPAQGLRHDGHGRRRCRRSATSGAPPGYDEHPPLTSDPAYVTDGHDLLWQRVQAVIDGGGWDGHHLHPHLGRLGRLRRLDPDPGHRDRPGRAAPRRVPGHRRLTDPADHVRRQGEPGHRLGLALPRVASRRRSSTCSGCPPMGVPRVDTAPCLADRVDPTLARPLPPAHGTTITQPSTTNPHPGPGRAGALARPDRAADARPGHPRRKRSARARPTAVVPHHATQATQATDARSARRHHRPFRPTGPMPTPPPPAPVGNLDELVDKAYAGKTAAELAAAPLDALKGVSPAKAAALNQALGVTTIGDLAADKYVHAAQTIAAADTPS